MEQNNELESGFKINNLILLESSFKRNTDVSFIQEDIIQKVNLDVKVGINGNIVLVTEELIYNQLVKDIEQVSSTIRMIGVFEKIGSSKLDLELFGHINGAAIIFPYIREHLTNLSAKAGIGLIYLPPANFTKKTEKV